MEFIKHAFFAGTRKRIDWLIDVNYNQDIMLVPSIPMVDGT